MGRWFLLLTEGRRDIFGLVLADGMRLAAIGGAVVASCIPARRAMRVDPMTAVRCESRRPGLAGYDEAPMTPIPDRRLRPDRRSQPRGGRRPTDIPGLTPLVLVVDADPEGRQICETILAKLHFAVAPADSVEQALRIMTALRPDVVVARGADVGRLREEAPLDEHGLPVPFVAVGDVVPEADVLVEDIRRALRAWHQART